MSDEQRSLLIVDDEELNREGLARRLQQHGYAVTVAASGRQAIELLGERRFDLMLLDIMMPGMNGLEVLKFLRRVDSLIELPIIMVSAKGESEDMVEALELGANDYVTKPLDLPVVLARIRTQLALKSAVSRVTDLEQKIEDRNQDLVQVAADLAAANQRMTRDLEAAARIQRALRPARPPEVAGATFAWAFEPSSQLASGFLNVFPLDDRHLGLYVLDVSDRGVAAALLSIAASQLLVRIAAPRGTNDLPPPARVAVGLAEQLSGEATAGHSFSLLYGVFQLETGAFRFISAGHPGPIHLPAGKPPVVLEATGFPVGVGPGNYREEAVTLRPGDRLVLFSDGVTEARNRDGAHFGVRRLLDTLNQSRLAPLADNLRAVAEAVEKWRGTAPRQDDFSILIVERTDPPDRRAEPGSAATAEDSPDRPGQGGRRTS
jgi:sigma-B regulation protein RsbU (phosphoserine phosphatase)